MPTYDRSNIFARILRGEAPCTKVYEDEFTLAVQNIHPRTPVDVSSADFRALAPPEPVVGTPIGSSSIFTSISWAASA